jgi:hypothetical protein
MFIARQHVDQRTPLGVFPSKLCFFDTLSESRGEIESRHVSSSRWSHNRCFKPNANVPLIDDSEYNLCFRC